MIISEMRESDCPAWDDYIRNSAHGLPYHLSGWRNIFAETYGYQTHYLIATESGQVVGVFPILFVRSFLVGSRATSVQGGLCADDEMTAAALIEQGKEVAARAGLRKLVLQDTRLAWTGNLHTTSSHVHWTIDIDSKPDSIWQNLPRNVRRGVKKAQKNGLDAKVDYQGERLGDLYNVLSRFAHQTGSPFFGRNFLESVIRSFPGGYHSVLVYREKQPLGGYFHLDMGRTTYGVWGSTLPDYLPLGATYLAYWTILCDAAEAGFRTLDLGRSPSESNSSAFKARWGGISEPIFQQVINLQADGAGGTITDQIQTGGKFQLFMRVWPKLPYPVAQSLGPKLRRHVPFA